MAVKFGPGMAVGVRIGSQVDPGTAVWGNIGQVGPGTALQEHFGFRDSRQLQGPWPEFCIDISAHPSTRGRGKSDSTQLF